MILSSPVTHTDWMSRFSKDLGDGRRSVRKILDRCKEVGWTRLYWRCLDGGQALYKSRIMEGVHRGYTEDNYHAWANPGMDITTWLKPFKNLDSFGQAVEYGHKIGLEIHAWLSINEDDHAWGLASRFSRGHPQFRWVKRNGCPYNSQLSFAFPEVRDYKLHIVREVLRYDLDGVFFDWIRTGDIRNNPQADPKGTADYGYEIPLVEGFKKKFGIDPRSIPNHDERWVRFRAEPHTIFLRRAHEMIKSKSKRLPVSAMVHHRWGIRGSDSPANGPLFGQLLDVERWAKDGLIDEIVAAGYYTKGGTPEKAFRYLKGLVKNRCKIWMYGWVPGSVKDFRESVRIAEKVGASQILYWESDYIGLPRRGPRAREVNQTIRMMAEYTRRQAAPA
jgi:uncharacterized lipoprotein YddW (UPF0748 family)